MSADKTAHIAGLTFLFVLPWLTFPQTGLSSPNFCEPATYSSDPFTRESYAGRVPGLFAIPGTAPARRVDRLLEHAMAGNLITGGVVLIGNHDGILSITTRGRLDSRKGAPRLDESTIFDLASLTKVVATAPSVMKLLDEGKIDLSDPLMLWFPEFRGSRYRNVTILKLLTHTSGLEDLRLRRGESMSDTVRRAAEERYHRVRSGRFKYADINFILLAELVRRVSGKPLDVFSGEQIYRPLGMKETMFSPPRGLDEALAPTLGSHQGARYFRGIAQDANARRLGGVAGHAGLFSSALDLSRFARCMLGRGALDGVRILSQQAVSEMTAPHLCGSTHIRRGLGWDMDSPYASPKGPLFSKRSFGHTGYSGSSIWIDPETDLFVVLLTNRLDYRHVARFNRLRRDISIVAATQFGRIEPAYGASGNGTVTKIAGEPLPGNRQRQTATSPKVKRAHRPYGRFVTGQGKTTGTHLTQHLRKRHLRPRT